MKIATIIAIAAGVFLLSDAANAGPVAVGAHVGSMHSDSGYCNTNPGAYARWSNGFTLGAYRNSECRTSVYAARTIDLVQRGPYALSLTMGAVTGYSTRAINPLLVPSLRVDLEDGWSMRLAYVPKVSKAGAHAVHLMLEVRL